MKNFFRKHATGLACRLVDVRLLEHFTLGIICLIAQAVCSLAAPRTPVMRCISHSVAPRNHACRGKLDPCFCYFSLLQLYAPVNFRLGNP